MKCRSRALKGAKTTVKYDPTDLSKIYVFDDSNYQFIEVPALNQDYTKGLSLWQHRVVKQLAAQEANQVDIVALALAKEKIQKIVEREWNLSKKGKTRTAMARWLGIGRDGINTSSVSKRENQPIPVNETAFQDNISINQDSGITGISDLENAFNSIPEEVEIEKIAPDVFSEADVQPTQKAKQTKPKQEIETNNQDWQPNLEGWSVTIGLPKGGET